ncbi:MAG: hypothetical protein LBI33_10830 [Propionibacteriaceae bacterium]|jgi:hypothetical protein|nr:hypothetical protein [Propionibacteriaceae bacterium]
MAVTLPTTLTDQVRLSSLIVDATVKRVLPAEPRVINIVPGSAEAQINAKTGGSETTAAFGEIEFTVNEVLKGDAGESLVMDISPLADGCAPEFTPGDRFVLFLFQNDEGHLFSVALQDAYWYVAKDARVYPAVVTDQLKTYSGKGLGPFKSAINAIKRELK